MKKLLPAFLLAILLFLPFCTQTQKRPRTDHWLEKTKQFEMALNTEQKGGYIFFGNSITEGFDLNKFFPDWPSINRGISGDHIDGLIERIYPSVIRLEPSKLFLMIGINDIGDGRSDAYLREKLSALFAYFIREIPEAEIYVHSVLPTSPQWDNCPPDQIKRLNNFLKNVFLSNGFHYVDLYPHFVEAAAPYLKAKLTDDGLHLNEEGYKLWAEVLNGMILRDLEKNNLPI